jgi:hypothetical protein
MTGGFDGGTQVFVDLHGDLVAVLLQQRGDGQKWIEMSGRRYRSDKNFHEIFPWLVGEIEAGFCRGGVSNTSDPDG